MKVIFDHQTFTMQQYGGISRYFFEVIQRFKNTVNSAEVSMLFSNNAYLNAATDTNLMSFLPNTNFRGKGRIQFEINSLYTISKLRDKKFDIFHPTYYNPYFLKHLGNKPFVITVLDMIHEKFADEYKELAMDTKLFSNKKLLVNNASKIIAISQSTKNDIIDIYGVPADNIEVIHLGSSLESVNPDIVFDRLVREPYLLFVGTRTLYKNFRFYLESIAEILKRDQLILVCAGGGEFNTNEIELIDQLGLKRFIKYHPINDEILRNLYSNSIAFVFPSKYEGFGIPVLEAFSSNCPCLLSNGGSLPEVGGDAAIYFDPYNSQSIKKALNLILSDNKVREGLISKGSERLESFSWDKTFQQTITVYESLI